ncbi:hypothetical protein KIN20_025061 [Parelaphostrongylus tenuis]|uniref:Mos1 transposase HTH domain-containing protein n=1 Tax=Parelaphostrongylus tenuis TaxID=148309 RepID=A0AAD5QX40_PARTN|nr:hypothetical protein KIN20_025061 [Parelaphostrongylus tenuis]
MHEWLVEENISEAVLKINGVWSDDTVAERTAKKWFAKFKGSLENRSRLDRPQEAPLILSPLYWHRATTRYLCISSCKRFEDGFISKQVVIIEDTDEAKAGEYMDQSVKAN